CSGLRPVLRSFPTRRSSDLAFLAGLPALRPFPELKVAGLVSLNGSSGAGEELGVPWLGSADELTRIAHEVSVDDVILLSPTTWKDRKSTRLNSSHDQISYAV